MALTPKSHVVSGTAGHPVPAQVRPEPTCAALGSSRVRGAAAALSRNLFAGRSLAAALVAAGTLLACGPRLQGNGVYLEKNVDVGPFTALRIEDGVGALITVGPELSQKVTVSGDENLVRDHIKTSLDVDGVGSAAVTILHVWVDPSSYDAVIPPVVVISRPAFSLVRARDGSVVELRRQAGSSAVGGPLAATLEDASVNARQYPTSGAVVALTAASTALLHSDGPVTGTVSAGSHLDNTAGVGPCQVTTTAGASVVCN